MTDFKRINEPRVDKMLALLGLIIKSGASSKATQADYVDLFETLMEELEWVASPNGVTNTTPAPTEKHPLQVARDVPLRQGVNMMTIIASRVEQEMWEAEQ